MNRPTIVYLSNQAMADMLLETAEHVGTETGGILLGVVDGDRWYVVESLDPGPNSILTETFFEYNHEYLTHLANKVARRYRTSLRLLGLWHRHPGSFDSFSGTDDKTNQRYVNDCGGPVISGLVNLDPDFRMTFYLVQGPPVHYTKIRIEVGDEHFPSGLLARWDTPFLKTRLNRLNRENRPSRFATRPHVRPSEMPRPAVGRDGSGGRAVPVEPPGSLVEDVAGRAREHEPRSTGSGIGDESERVTALENFGRCLRYFSSLKSWEEVVEDQRACQARKSETARAPLTRNPAESDEDIAVQTSDDMTEVRGHGSPSDEPETSHVEALDMLESELEYLEGDARFSYTLNSRPDGLYLTLTPAKRDGIYQDGFAFLLSVEQGRRIVYSEGQKRDYSPGFVKAAVDRDRLSTPIVQEPGGTINHGTSA